MTTLPRLWGGGAVAVALVPQATDRRTTARQAVATLLGRPVSTVALRREPGGKPVLASPREAACSFAHRHGFTLTGVSWAGHVGVDLELVREDLAVDDIARAFFAPCEAAWVLSLGAGERSLGFTALWCAKEAVLKATGQGITGGLHEPVVSPAGAMPLLRGADATALFLANGARVELRRCHLAARPAVASVAHLAAR